jgi:sugar lactone lactonase YvrE
MTPLAAQLLHDGKAELAEGPVWHDGALWWVDILAGTFNRFDTASGINSSRATGDFLGAAFPTTHGDWLLARRHQMVRMDWLTGRMETLATLDGAQGRLRFNDGKCDPSGRLLLGTMHRDGATGAGALYQFSGGGLNRVLDGVTVSNGMDWSPDGARFYYADSPTGRVDVFDYDPETGTMDNRRVLITVPSDKGVPDGLCCDQSGNIWLALWDGGGVECFDGSSGASLERIELPVKKVTSCCFGGSRRDQLFITTAWEGNDRARRDAEPLAGGIFVVQPGVCGQAPKPAELDPPAA